MFDYAAWFPDSDRCQSKPTFGEYAQIWLKRKRADLEKSTLAGYVKNLNRYWLPPLSDLAIDDITTGLLKDTALDIDVGAKTFNNSLTPLRQVFDAARDDGVIEHNPAEKLKSRKRGKPPAPDPLTVREQDQFLEWLAENDPHWRPYFAVALDTGMRPSELIALRWSNVDLNTGYIRIDEAYVEQQTKGPKTTAGHRDIEMGALTRAALGKQKSASAKRRLVGHDDDLVFWDTAGNQINNDKPPRLVWNRALDRLQIRARKAYSTRHTFATTALMARLPVGWISKQMGHSSIRQTMDTYATWIEKLDRGSERAKMDEARANK